MPRRKNEDGPKPPPKPRVRKKKEPVMQQVEQKMESVYDPQMLPNGVPMMLDDGMYGGPPPDYYYNQGQPPFGSPDPSSPYVSMPPTSSTPQPNPGTPNMMMRGMPGSAQPGGPPMAPLAPAVPSPLEYRIHDVNRRLYIFNNSGINEKDHAQWWDAFAHEFFDDTAKMTFNVFDETTQQQEAFTIGRNLIPRYFRSVFDSGVKDLQYLVRCQAREAATSNGYITFDCEHVLMITKHDRPMISEVQTECKFVIEFTQYEEMFNHRIHQWTMDLKHSQEYVLNEMTKQFDPLEHEKKSLFCRPGITRQTLEFFQLCAILEPMSILMGHSKGSGMDPRESMKRVLFQQHQRLEMARQQQQMAMQQQMANSQSGHMMPPAVEEPKAPKAPRKRQRKPAANSKNKKANQSPAPTNPTFPPNQIHGTTFGQIGGYDSVMIVGEPSMMGSTDFAADEDERTISRVENAQYDPNALQMSQGLAGPGPMGGPPQGLPPGMPGGMGPPPGMGPQGMQPGQPPNLVPLGPPNGLPPPGQQTQDYPGFDYNTQQWQRPPSNTTMITG